MEAHSLEVTRTARIYTLGTLTEKTENVWIVLHGYAMLAQYFIQKFDQLDPEKNFIIAPEGLSRLYQNGLNGRIGASWMTAEDRLNEIKDYTLYLDKVYQTYVEPHTNNRKIIGLGFSQGVSTLLRWLNSKQYNFHHIIAWAGSIPNDVLENYSLWNNTVQIYYGTEDPLLSKEQVVDYLKNLDNHQIPYQVIEYQGGHTLIKEEIKNLINTK